MTADPPMVFRQKRAGLAGLAAASLLGVIIAIGVVTHPELFKPSRHPPAFDAAAGWATTIFFSLVTLVLGAASVRPGRVVLGPDGIAVTTLWRSWTCPWDDVGAVSLWRQNGAAVVFYADHRPKRSRPSSVGRRGTGVATALPTQLNVSPEALLTAIEAAKARWGAGPDGAVP